MIFRGFFQFKMTTWLFPTLLFLILVNGGLPAVPANIKALDNVMYAVPHSNLSTSIKEFNSEPPEVDIKCNTDGIKVTISTHNDFNGMIYPKGLHRPSPCFNVYNHAGSQVSYVLPLRACRTMSRSMDEGVEYFNTVVVQPHHMLETTFGKTIKVRCQYENEVINEIANLPHAEMKIFAGQPEDKKVAMKVDVGDYLTIVISIEQQDTYGIKIRNCIVKDGFVEKEQALINNEGCPVDKSIMGPFEYSEDLTSAHVTFTAHRFPDSHAVYYQCNVKLCAKKNGECNDAPPVCDETGHNLLKSRRKRQKVVEVKGDELEIDEDIKDRTVDVFSGVYVTESENYVDDATNVAEPVEFKAADEFCVSTRKFAIGIAIAGVLLCTAVILLVACIVNRRRRKQGTSTAGSSIYSGPYSNHAYSRD